MKDIKYIIYITGGAGFLKRKPGSSSKHLFIRVHAASLLLVSGRINHFVTTPIELASTAPAVIIQVEGEFVMFFWSGGLYYRPQCHVFFFFSGEAGEGYILVPLTVDKTHMVEGNERVKRSLISNDIYSQS